MRLFPTPRFTFAPMVRLWGSPDRADVETARPIQLRAGDKLLILRSLDRDGKWESLNDKRECLRCGTVFSGRQVDVVGGTRALGPLRLLCPSEDCQGNQNDWVVPGQRPRAGPFQPLLAGPVSHFGQEQAPLNEPIHFVHGSVVRVKRKRRARAEVMTAGPLPVPSDKALQAGAVKRIARFLSPTRARA